MNSLVPDLEMVPRLLTTSDLVMPMPLSTIVSVLLTLSGMMWMNRSGCASSLLLSVRLSNLILSKACENHTDKHTTLAQEHRSAYASRTLRIEPRVNGSSSIDLKK